MIYARIVHGQIAERRNMPDGWSPELVARKGLDWRPVDDPGPASWDPETQTCTRVETVEPDAVRIAYEIADKPLPELQTRAKAKVAADRYAAECGGITIAGMEIDTERDSQAKLTSVRVMLQTQPDYVLHWKCVDGTWHDLDAAAITAVTDAVYAHVQTCYTRESELCAAIEACTTVDEFRSLDLTF